MISRSMPAVLTAFLLASCSSVQSAGEEVTTVILVRHAEKTGPTGDVPLSGGGNVRAADLARILASAGVRAIYVTPTVRTRQTAAPMAAVLALEPIAIATGEEYARDVAREIKTRHRGSTVLVVGHSNTTPIVLRELGVKDPPAIADSEYDALFICTMTQRASPPKLLVLRYGVGAK